MRGIATELGTPHPLEGLLPAALQEDELTRQLTAGLDAVLAPVLATLDCLYAYLDPAIAPADFLEWLAGWVGVTLDETWPTARRRDTVAGAVALYQSRGTVAGLRAQLELVTGGRVEIVDSGGVTWSATPVSGHTAGEPQLVVRIGGLRPGTPVSAVDELVAAAKPAHVPHRVEIVAD